jgi:hypothetical protein
MYSLVWKEFQEFKIPLLIQVLFGGVVCLVLHYFKALETSVLVFVLFIFTAPCFCLLNGQRMFSPEVKCGTLPFLVGLPLSRSRIWLGKLLSAFLANFLMYLVFCSLTVFTEVSILGVDHFTFFAKNLPSVSMIGLFWSIPVFTTTLALFVSTLPSTLGTVVFGLNCIALFLVLFSPAVYSFNALLALNLMAIVYLISGYQSFVFGELLESWKQRRRGLISLVGGTLLAFAIWTGLDQLADRLDSGEKLRDWDIHDFSVKDSSLLVSANRQSVWWDPIRTWEQPQLFRFFPRTQELHPISPRLTDFQGASSDGRYLAALTTRGSFGFAQAEELVLIDTHRENSFQRIETHSDLIGFIDDTRFIYERKLPSTKGFMLEIVRFEIGSGSTTVFSNEGVKYLRPRFLPFQKSLLFNPRLPNAEPILVNVLTGKITKVSRKGSVWPALQLEKGTILAQALDRLGENRTFSLLNADGTIQELPWIPSSMMKIGTISETAFLARVPLASSPDDLHNRSWAILRLDLADATVTEVTRIDSVPEFSGRFHLTADQKFLTITQSPDRREQYRYSRLNLETGEIREIPLNLVQPRLYPLGGAKGLIQSRLDLFLIDLETMNTELMGKFPR